jgi:hypothetical protein
MRKIVRFFFQEADFWFLWVSFLKKTENQHPKILSQSQGKVWVFCDFKNVFTINVMTFLNEQVQVLKDTASNLSFLC